MMKKIALIAAAVAIGVGIACLAAEGGRYEAVIVNPLVWRDQCCRENLHDSQVGD